MVQWTWGSIEIIKSVREKDKGLASEETIKQYQNLT